MSSIHIDAKSSGPHKASVTDFIGKNPIFVCVTSYTETSQIPGITIAGADPELIPCTPEPMLNFYTMDNVNLFLGFQQPLMASLLQH